MYNTGGSRASALSHCSKTQAAAITHCQTLQPHNKFITKQFLAFSPCIPIPGAPSGPRRPGNPGSPCNRQQQHIVTFIIYTISYRWFIFYCTLNQSVVGLAGLNLNCELNRQQQASFSFSLGCNLQYVMLVYFTEDHNEITQKQHYRNFKCKTYLLLHNYGFL